MPGVLTHLAVSFAGFLISLLYFKEYKYAFAFVIGQLIPDTIKFGIPGILFKTSNFREIISKPLFWKLDSFTHSFYFWLVICIIFVLMIFILYKTKKINKKKFKVWMILNGIFLLSIAIHLILDMFIIEKSYWI